jgi:HD-GYP domain-containing protein (c-di-GMP phosphodiesterase class II)
MKRIGLEELQPGTKYSKPVYVDGENLLVPEEIAIRQRDIDRLKNWGIDYVMTDGVVLTEMSKLEQSATAIGNILDMKGDPEQLSVYQPVVADVDKVFQEIRTNAQPNKKNLDTGIDRIIDATIEFPDEMVAMVLRSEPTTPALGKSAIDCAILSLLIGTGMSMDRAKLRNLAYGAALHDVGMVRVPDVILQKKTDLTIEEIKTVRTHTLHSYKILSKDLGYPEEIGLISLQHHERWDGKGYPRQLSQRHISVEARIVSVADAFEAMMKERPYRNSMIGYAAMRQLLTDNSRRFDSDILKIFIKAIGIYPLGSFVLLNNGGIGRVIKINRGAPLRPALKLLIDPGGTRYLQNDGAIVDLLDEKDVFIAKAIDPKKALGATKST